MALAMSWTQVAVNIAMAVVGGLGGFALGYWVRGLAKEEMKVDGSTTGVLRVRGKRITFNQVLSFLVVVVVLVLMITGAVTQAQYDRRLQCNSNYINAFQETLRVNAAATTRSNQTQLDNVRAQRAFLDSVDEGQQDPAAFRTYVGALDNYERSLRAAIEARQPYPQDPNCEEQ